MKPLSTRAYARLLLYPFGVFAAVFWMLVLLVQPVVGDLTRIGEWTENDFGWNSRQPVIDVRANGAALTNPEIVVLGDSFSVINNHWQSAVSAQLGKRLLTFGYDDVGCIDNWVRWASEASQAKTVVVEIVERNFVGVIGKQKTCAASKPAPVEIAAGPSSSARNRWPPTLDAKYLFHSVLNTVRLHFSPDRAIAGEKVINAPIRPGCGNFSNRRSDRLLYYIDDEYKRNWTSEGIERSIGHVRQMQRIIENSGKRFVFVVVPDKSSIYRSCMLEQNGPVHDITGQLISAGIETPDLMTLFRSSFAKTVDLYYPDNTHWSESGALLMAGKMAEILKRAPAAR